MLSFILLQILALSPAVLLSVRGALKIDLNLNRSNPTNKFTIYLIENCLLRDDRTVALIGNVPDTIVNELHRLETAVMTSIGNYRPRSDGLYGKILYSNYLYRQSFWIGLQRIVHAFVIAAPSQPILRRALETAKTTVWWNSAAFFIVTNPPEKNDCRNAFIYLWTLWQSGILNSIFLCEDDVDESIAVYAYSPYYDGHSESWEKVEVYDGRDGHPWVLLKLKQVHDPNVCETIAFDKVQKLNGHVIPIGVLVIPPTLMINETGRSWFEKYRGEDAMIIHTIWKALNGTMKEVRYDGKDPIGLSRANGNYTGFVRDVSQGRVDHGMNGLYAGIHWRFRSAYPHAASGVYFLTYPKGIMPNWLKMVTIYDLPVCIAILITLLSSIIFLHCFDQQPWSMAILNVLRMIFSSSMSRIPSRLSSQIFLGIVFCMVLITTSGFQGRFISLLTTPSFYRNIDGLDDLLASHYPIHGYPAFKPFFEGSELLTERFNSSQTHQWCLQAVLEKRPVACVSEYLNMKTRTLTREEYHMSKAPIAPFYTGYFTRLDWPLFRRFNTLVQRLFNSGVTGYWRKYYLDQIIREQWEILRRNSVRNLKVLAVDDLAFIFHTLIAGLIGSFAIFVIEVILGCISRYRINREN
ncbi:uncharacterized protein LOC125501040 [Athalia rosae]|uniref:uncharacterized protein LOC125501040 n=1 Tax=Athalia rosae TaxID=37344 RepID=UPI0020347678|nr:uncharacterized protein LOC125501040 [Athalia rosae]